MLSIRLEPHEGHCIETAARLRHRALVGILLEDPYAPGKVSDEAELLREFLETADLPFLRAESERHLVEGRRVVFTVERLGGAVTWRMDVD